MNKLYIAIVGVCLTAVTVFGQLPTVPPTPDTNGPPPSVQKGIQDAADAIKSGRWALVGLAEWAQKKNEFGGRLNLFYRPESTQDMLVVGPSIEYINNQAEFVSVNLTLQLPIKIGPLTYTPWTAMGTGTPIGQGKSTTVAGEAAAGLQITLKAFGKKKQWHLGLVGGVEKRTDIDGMIIIGGPDISYNW